MHSKSLLHSKISKSYTSPCPTWSLATGVRTAEFKLPHIIIRESRGVLLPSSCQPCFATAASC
jgi:hypothetical protein